MASESEDPDGAAARLEAALERIAVAAAERPVQQAVVAEAPSVAPEAIERLDSLIERLRGALDGNRAG